MLEKYIEQDASGGRQSFTDQLKELNGAKMMRNPLFRGCIDDDGVIGSLAARQKRCTIVDVAGDLRGERKIPYALAKENDGAPGVDGVTFEARGRWTANYCNIDDGTGSVCFGQHRAERPTAASDHQHLMDRDLRQQTEHGVYIGGQADTVTISFALQPPTLPVDVRTVRSALHYRDFRRMR